MKAAYTKMHDALKKAGRAIVLKLMPIRLAQSLGMGGAAVGGNLWRTTGDINDEYRLMAERSGSTRRD